MGENVLLKSGEGAGDPPRRSASAQAETSTDPVSISRGTIMRAAWLRRTFTLLLLVFVLAGALSVFGVNEERVVATAAGYELTVEYSAVTRPGLRTPWKIRVERAGGFDGPLELRTNSSYLELFDYHQMYPEPAAMRRDGQWTILEFQEPAGDRFEFSFDARISPATLRGSSARTAVLEYGRPVVEVQYRTRVMP